MKYDGSGYPRTKIKTRKQHLISQLVAIADVFDALRTRRSYRPSFEIQEILGILKQDAGREFNPMLLDNFLTACERAKAL